MIKKVGKMGNKMYESCKLCPRECGVDRSRGKIGYCLSGADMRVAKTMLHMWEEPPISGTRGSGAIFFCGCSLGCVFCQNKKISRSIDAGESVSIERLADIMLSLEASGAHNINLVTPMHYAPSVALALERVKHRLTIPVVCNTGGYDKVETLKLFSGLVDIYLPDFKYCSSELSVKYSAAPDYFEVASSAVSEMYRQVGSYAEKDGLAERGVIVRHLVLPGARADSQRALDALAGLVPVNDIRLSLMGQYTPDFYGGEDKLLKRRITSFEYNSVLEHAISLGFDGFFQERGSADKKYTPDF